MTVMKLSIWRSVKRELPPPDENGRHPVMLKVRIITGANKGAVSIAHGGMRLDKTFYAVNCSIPEIYEATHWCFETDLMNI